MANLFRCGGGRSEASYQNLMDQLIEETATGSIASFADGANNIPAKEIICHINPTETGTGEKSPSNPYVIGGFTEAKIAQQSTIPVTNNAPYLFRQSGGDNNADVYNQETDKLVGASAVVNQICNVNDMTTATYNNIEFTKNTTNNTYSVVGTMEEGKSSAYRRILSSSQHILGHVYYYNMSGSTNPNLSIGYNGTPTVLSKKTNILKPTVLGGFYLWCAGANTTYNDTVQVVIIDLTSMFGTAIADYVYSLEQATAGSGIAYLRKYGFFTKDYYPYTANTLQSVNASAHITQSANRWDEDWELGGINSSTGEDTPSTNSIRTVGFISAKPSTVYYMVTQARSYIVYYDVNKNRISSASVLNSTTITTPPECYYIRFAMSAAYGATYNNDISINYPSTITDYHKYVKHEYALPNIDLRGLYKLDASNNLYADGDTLEGDGTLTRKYGIVDLGSLDWTASTSYNNRFIAPLFDMKMYETNVKGDAICNKYATLSFGDSVTTDKSISCFRGTGGSRVGVTDSAYTDAQTFKTAMEGVMFVYPLATPTIESSVGFTNPQTVSKDGTEEYVDTRDFPMPVGHETEYLPTKQMDYNISFGQIVYGGELILQEGQNDKLIPWEYIASYNGEVINEPWVSSMDAYAPGTTPTTGAFVCYPAADPAEITLPTKTVIPTLLGANNIYHDCNGDTDVTYRANGALYVQEHPITRGLMAARPTEQIQEQEEQQEEKEIIKSEDSER